MAHAQNILETYAETTKSAFDYWISFFPTAPMFGVDWRYGDLMTDQMNAWQAGGFADALKPTAEVIDITPKVAPEVVEPVEAPVEVEIEAAAEVAPVETPELFETAPDVIDALTDIKGVGPGLEKQLHGLGIYTFAQLADLNDVQLEWLDENLSTVKGRCIRDDWSGQAKALMG